MDTTTLLLAFSVATLYIFEMVKLFIFQNIFYQGHRHQYSSTVKTYSISIKNSVINTKSKK